MSGPVVALLVQQMDRSLGRIRPKLDGLTDEEFFWEPVQGCWTVHRRRAEDRAWAPDVQQFVNGSTKGPLTDRRRGGQYEVDLLGGEV